MVLDEGAWWRDAKCAAENQPDGKPVTDFLFVKGESDDLTHQAKIYCHDCPVRWRCLEAGLSEVYGIWGGMTRIDRIRLLRLLRRGATAQDVMEYIAQVDDRAITTIYRKGKTLAEISQMREESREKLEESRRRRYGIVIPIPPNKARKRGRREPLS